MGPASLPEDDTAETSGGMPSWLLSPQDYTPPRDRDSFISHSQSKIASVLSQLRLDDGHATPLSPSAPVKLLVGLVAILLTSLSTNFAFVLAILAAILVRVALLPARALRRTAGVACVTTGVSALLMLPAVFLGQPQSLLLVTTKVLVSTSIALTVALSTPAHELTGALRTFFVPNLAIMTVDLALKNIVSLGNVALEVLCALGLRSVGRNTSKGTALGGTGGIVFLKAHKAARDTSDAMQCRGFVGEYPRTRPTHIHRTDVGWMLAIALVLALFCYLETQV